MNERIVSTLVGLAGACGNNGKTEQTDAVVLHALLNCYAPEDGDTIVAAITREKYSISPNCETCLTPCGNTSDYAMELFHEDKELKTIKEELMKATVALATRLHNAGKTELPEEIYQAISYFGYALSVDSYTDLIQILNRMEVQ